MIITTATNKKVREILKSLRENSLLPRPEFQRRLVWTLKDKDRFIESVLNGYPFPEIYICNGDVDTETGEGTQLLVDGLQRISTLQEYFEGDGNFSHVLSKPYKELTQNEKSAFLEYTVVVRDLGQIGKEQIIEVFKRLNSTQYTLRDMEINNAIYDGALKQFCERISENSFFENHRVFSSSDRKRMGDVSFCLSLIGTMMYGYFNRDSEHENLLSKFNEIFVEEREYFNRIQATLDFIDECGFDEKARIWKKADFFSAFIEIENLLNVEKEDIDPLYVVNSLNDFYIDVDKKIGEKMTISDVYYTSALQASNDRLNRVRRGFIISGILRKKKESEIIESMKEKSIY